MHEVIILSDEEFYANQQKEKRKMFLEELEQMSKPSKGNSFSIKNVKQEEDTKKENQRILTLYLHICLGLLKLKQMIPNGVIL